jgi:hypothetical protein
MIRKFKHKEEGVTRETKRIPCLEETWFLPGLKK